MMKRKMTAILALLLCLALVFIGCEQGGISSAEESKKEEPVVSDASSGETTSHTSERQPEESVAEESTVVEEPTAEEEPRTVTLNDGYKMPRVGLGTFTLSDETAENSTYHALLSGYRLIDTAKYYGNEAGVGRGVRRAIEEGIVTREEIFITTKILPYGFSDYAAAIDACNQALGLEYIDLMLIHTRGSDELILYKAIEEAISKGTVRSLGISNYYSKEAFDYITADAKILPVLIQNENHPYFQNTALQEYVSQYGIFIESYYPLGGRGHTQVLFNDETIVDIAKTHDKTSPQILIRWHYQAGYIVIPGSSNPDHIAENIAIFDFALSDEEMEQIANMHTDVRYETW